MCTVSAYDDNVCAVSNTEFQEFYISDYSVCSVCGCIMCLLAVVSQSLGAVPNRLCCSCLDEKIDQLTIEIESSTLAE